MKELQQTRVVIRQWVSKALHEATAHSAGQRSSNILCPPTRPATAPQASDQGRCPTIFAEGYYPANEAAG